LKKRFFQTILIVITTALILFSSLPPAFAQSEWTLQVGGAVNNNLNLPLDQLAAMPSTSVQADIYCGASFVIGGNWTGVALSQILEGAEANPQAESVQFTATDGYTVKIPILTAMRDDVIIAYQLNGQSFPEGLRLVIPGANGADWIAMVTQIIVSTPASPETAPFPPPLNGLASTTLTPTQATPTPTPAPTPTPTPTPTPDNQTTTQTATPPIESQPQPQEGSSTSSILEKYAFPLAFAAIMVAAATAITGYFIRKRRLKNPKT
jgi:DMSO/TMAO reductase YedYZ molybdopterin-dependent catalytic subunit